VTQPKHNVLFSLEMAALGNSGIPTETRLLFGGLAECDDVSLSGLLFQSNGSTTQFMPTRPRKGDESIHASEFLHLLGGGTPLPQRLPSRLHRLFKIARNLYVNDAYRTYPVSVEMFGDTLWRTLFMSSLAPSRRARVLASSFHYTNMTLWEIIASCLAPLAPRPKLHLPETYDFAIFQDARPVVCHPRTTKIMRYHDAIPVLHPDLIAEVRYSKVHHACVKRVRKDSHFVCNSNATRNALLSLFPDLEPRAHVIPCVVKIDVEPSAANLDAHDIIVQRRSFEVDAQSTTLVAAADPAYPPHARAPYVLAVATLEPKKNIESVVHAWARVANATNERFDLVIVGKRGWRYAPIVAAMAPHIRSGRLHHLQDVPTGELQALYRGAEAVLFPSYAEGFGLPSVEALAAGTAPIVSDIPTHREVLGEAAHFVDPYDVEDIAHAIETFALSPDRHAVRTRLLARAPAVLDKYRSETIIPQWIALFDRLRSR